MELSEKIALVLLTMIFPKGSAALHTLLEEHSSPLSALKALKNDEARGVPVNVVRRLNDITSNSPQLAQDIVSYCEKQDIRLLSIFDSEYPLRLKAISAPPVLLYCKGDICALQSKFGIAVVGARKASDYSAEVTKHFSSYLSQRGITIISGFANGIDITAHNAAVNSGGKTIAVLACGIDADYPKGRSESKKAIASNGLLVSEYPPLEKPERSNFKVRNRIISGLSNGVLVIQASENSGSLNTVSHALEQGRDVYVIPPSNILSKTYSGQIEILREGAMPVYDPNDIVLELLNLG